MQTRATLLWILFFLILIIGLFKGLFCPKKIRNKGFFFSKSFRIAAGFKRPWLYLRVMNNTRNLLPIRRLYAVESLAFVCKGSRFIFMNLVGFQPSPNFFEKEFFYKKMAEICKYGRHQQLRQDQYDYFSEWYYSALRSLLPALILKTIIRLSRNFSTLPWRPAKLESHGPLMRLGLLHRDPMASTRWPASALTAGDEVQSAALVRFHKQSLDLGPPPLTAFRASQRDVSGVTMSLSQNGFDKIKKPKYKHSGKRMPCSSRSRTPTEGGAFSSSISSFSLIQKEEEMSLCRSMAFFMGIVAFFRGDCVRRTKLAGLRRRGQSADRRAVVDNMLHPVTAADIYVYQWPRTFDSISQPDSAGSWGSCARRKRQVQLDQLIPGCFAHGHWFDEKSIRPSKQTSHYATQTVNLKFRTRSYWPRRVVFMAWSRARKVQNNNPNFKRTEAFRYKIGELDRSTLPALK